VHPLPDLDAALARLSTLEAWAEADQVIAEIRTFVLSLDYEDAGAYAAGMEVFEALSAKVLNLYRAYLDESRTSFSIGILVVPPLFASWGFQPADIEAWRTLQHTSKDRSTDLVSLLHGLIVDGVADDIDAALARFIEGLCSDGFVERLQAGKCSPQRLGVLLRESSWYVAGSPALKRTIANALARFATQGPQAFIALATTLTEVLAYASAADETWLDFVTQHCLVPQISIAAHDPHLADLAQRTEWRVYTALLKKIDTAEVWKRTYETMGPALAAAGRCFGAARYGTNQYCELRPLAPSPPRVAFFLWGDFSTAHAQTLCLTARGLRRLSQKPIEMLVYVIDGPGPNLSRLLHDLDGLDVKIRHPSQRLDFSVSAVDWLRAQATKDQVSAMVFVSVTMMMCFAAGARVAPLHIYWSMKYHSLHIPEIEGYLGMALLEHRPAAFGPHWRIGHTAVPFRFEPELTAEANAIRAKYGAPDAIILGCLGRADKIRNPAYIATLGRLMRAHPTTIYLWTGRSAPPDVIEMLRAEGIVERCHFCGWVNVRLYAQVLDIKLDSFPFASGFTCVETMAAGKPVVTLLTPESLESSTATSFIPIWEGRIGTTEDHATLRAMFTDETGATFAPFFDTIETYEAFSHRLIVDELFRRRVGNAGRLFVEKYLGDEERVGSTISARIVEIIDERRKSEI